MNACGLTGNLIRVNLVAALPSDPFDAWRSCSIPAGQVRQFDFDATRRLRRSELPENGLTEYAAYDVQGKLLSWQDALGRARGYSFTNLFDSVGRLTSTERIRGTSPSTPNAVDSDLFAGTGRFESASDFGPGKWEKGIFLSDYTTFCSAINDPVC